MIRFFLYKNFLFSHLYGVALSVTIVAATVSAIYAAEPHIENVSGQRAASVHQPAESAEKPLDEDDLYEFYHLAGNYDAFADLLRASDAYWDANGGVYNSADEMYAENNIEGFNHRGVHEMISNPISMYTLDNDPTYADAGFSHIYSNRYMDNESALLGEQCTSDIAKTLHSEGYRVAECNFVLCESEGEYNQDTHNGANIVKKLVYKFVYVEHEGKWYIVEDRLAERLNA